MKLTGETRQLGEKPVPVPLCPPQTPTWTDPRSNPGFRSERPATNRLSHGTALPTWIILMNRVIVQDSYLRILAGFFTPQFDAGHNHAKKTFSAD
jgi:hypothetical protein